MTRTQTHEEDRRRADDAVERALLKKAKGNAYTEQDSSKCKAVEYAESGKKVREYETLETIDIKKPRPPDLAAISLWLKARRPELWAEGRSGGAAIIDNIPPAPILTADEMAALAAARGGD